MAEEQDKSQQTEEATPKRTEDARKKGQVPTSKEASTALAFLLLASLAVTGLGAWMVSIFMDMTRSFLSGSVKLVADPQGMQSLFIDVMTDVALVVLPVAIPIMLVGMLMVMLISGPVFTFETLKPKFEKISPLKG